MNLEQLFNLSEVINNLESPSGWLSAVESIPWGFHFGNDGWVYLTDAIYEEPVSTPIYNE